MGSEPSAPRAHPRVTISTAHGSRRELDAASALATTIDRADLARLTYTRHVRIDEGAARSFSHPVLTLQPGHVLGPPREAVLSVYVHEQMHWAAIALPGCRAAIAEVRERWPNPPRGDAGGAADDESTWLHFPVCALELKGMTYLFDEHTAVQTVRSLPWYSWIYEQLTSAELPWRDYLDRHQIVLPTEPPQHQHNVSWVLAADIAQLRSAVGSLPSLLRDVPLDPDLVVRVLAICCLNLEHSDAVGAARLDPRNHEVYPLLDQHRPEVDATIKALRALQHPS